MSKNLTQKTLSGLIWQLGGAIFKFFLQFGVLVVLARLISKEDFGIVQSSLIVVGFSQLLSQMGIGPALVQITNLTSYHIRAGTTLSLILSIILFAIVFFSSGVFADFFNMPALQDVLRVVSVFFIFEMHV
jgi:PST family polysaccharide transporter